jgi:hypothetical protein
MGIRTRPFDRSNQSDPTTDGVESPAPLLRTIPMPEKMPKDDLGRDIAFLIAKHPSLAQRYGDVDLDAMTEATKVRMLTEIQSTLGIQPVNTRRLGYVGD